MRYQTKVIDEPWHAGSVKAVVVDTEKDWDGYRTVCECFSRDAAEKVAAALEMYMATGGDHV